MALYRIHRMKDHARTQFRWAPHAAGATSVRPRDFEPGGEIEASGCYDAWSLLKETAHALAVGDLLEAGGGELRVFKYVGFEEARWALPEPKQQDLAPAEPVESAPLC
jgi:hypothetical protein